jgi:hypothetical protein
MSSCRHFTPSLLGVVVFFTLSLTISGCKPSVPARIHTWMDETKKQAKPEDVRAALAPFFSYDGEHFSAAHIIWLTNQLPIQVQSLPIFSFDPTHIDVECQEDRNVLSLTEGSGFGHWGMVVLRPGYSKDFTTNVEYIPWGDGVYFYDEFK